MSTTAASLPLLDLPRLGRLLREVDPGALLVSRRILQRVIKRDRRVGGLGLAVPHRKSYVIDRQRLWDLASPAEVAVASADPLPETVLLLEAPEGVDLVDNPPGQVLRYAWRLLFHLRVHREVSRLRREGRLSDATIQARVACLGANVFAEGGEVLRQENYLLDPDDRAAVWEEFTAAFLELYFFDPHRLGQFFPAVEDADAAFRLLAEGFDAAELLRQTRPPGADDPGEPVTEAALVEAPPPAPADMTTTAPNVLRLRAERVARKGNLVRAAVYHLRAARLAPAGQKGALHSEARGDVEALVGRLQRALQLPVSERADWVRCLAALAEPASRGSWSAASRLLYDLQKVCTDVERPAFAADLIEWFVSWFRRPIKRPLPDLPLVLVVKHLRQARSRLPVVALEASLRRRLDGLTAAALRAAEARLRRVLRPKLLAGLDAVGMAPANAAEGYSRDKLVEELLDLVTQRGYLTLGDLRDGLARSQLKLPDLDGPITFFRGDPLIRLNRDLTARLDGVYRRGEIYLRWLQRLSSLFFGTAAGRLLTLYILLPLLGSFFLLKGIDGLSEELHKFIGAPEVHTFYPGSFAALALFLVPTLHVPRFRGAVFRGLWYLWRALRGVLYDLPAAVLRTDAVRAILRSRTYLFFYQYAGKPLAWTVPLGLFLVAWGAGWPTALRGWAAAAVVFSLLLNSRLGMMVEETASDWFGQTWRLVRDDIVPGVFRWIMWASRWLLERVDKMLYAVDEFLRFREGDTRVSFVAKLAFGLFWFAVTYVVRLVVNVFVEPQINPIKHFPVVTVSHKLMLLLVKPIAELVAPWLGMPVELAMGVVAFFLALIPGMFGFLAWELMANWRLYRANRPPTLEPEVVGSHGERVMNLLRPGFHSGTLPKLFARLRRATGSGERKKEEALHHVEEAVEKFVERDLLAVVHGSRAWRGQPALAVQHVHMATNGIRVEIAPSGPPPSGGVPVPSEPRTSVSGRGHHRLLTCAARTDNEPPADVRGSDGDSSPTIRLALTYYEGWLVGDVSQTGLLESVPERARGAFDRALCGFFHFCGVNFVPGPLRQLPSGGDYVLSRHHLTVFLDAAHTHRVEYDLDNPDRAVELPAGCPLPACATPWLFARHAVRWDDWVACWEADREGTEPQSLCFGGPGVCHFRADRVLPARPMGGEAFAARDGLWT